MKGKIIVISGPSGVGKGTICKALRELVNAKFSVSTTTRQPREGEIDGVHYFFVTEEEFMRRKAAGYFLETNKYKGNYYATSRDAVLDLLNKGENIVLEIDVNGAENIKKLFPDAFLIYIAPPSIEELRQRLIDRATEPIEEINERMAIAEEEKKKMGIYDVVLVNDDLQKTIEETKKLILKKI